RRSDQPGEADAPELEADAVQHRGGDVARAHPPAQQAVAQERDRREARDERAVDVEEGAHRGSGRALLDVARDVGGEGHGRGCPGQWIVRARPSGVTPAGYDVVAIPPSRRRRAGRVDPRLEATLATGDDPLLAPLRVAWLPPEGDGARAARLSRLLAVGDPRDPGRLRQAQVLRRHPDRCRVVVAEPAPASELRERWRRTGGTDVGHTAGLSEFVARQAALALDRAERRLRGARYKVPRFVEEEIVARPAFRGAVARLARRLGRDDAGVTREARR